MIYALVFLLGLMLGSFYNVCIYRIPREESIAFPPSHCTACSTRLKTIDLIPVFSWLFLRGRCRYCHDKISWQYPFIELLTGCVFLVLFIKYGPTWIFVSYAVLSSILIIATLIDLKYEIIPNGLVLTGAIAGAAFVIAGVITNLIFNKPVPTINWKDSLIGALVGGGTFLLVALLSYLILKKEGMGGGDVKLMAMIGLIIGWKLTALSILLSVYMGGLIGGALLLLRIKKRGDHIPYGPFIAAGTFLAILFGNDIIQWYINTFIAF